jgi:iron complex transport system ATP-binding protein
VSEPKTIALHTTNLVVGYTKDKKDFPLFEELNLSLHSGELVCFMGSNGIGKTTLIKTLAGLQKPLHGSAEFPDNQSVALVLTDRITSSLMTVYDLVTYGRYPYLNWDISLSARDLEIIENAIKQVHLEVLVNKRLYELSDGQLQMAMLAKALAQNTPILFLDEPTAHLDLNNRVEIMNILRSLSRTSGKTILIATHELDLALQTADRIWLATPDRKILQGIPEDLVLDGTFDEVFQFKGFDLKTGKVSHEAYRKVTIQLDGNGYEYLWTKNAFERNGYEVKPSASIKVSVLQKGNKLIWTILMDNKEGSFNTLAELLESLENLKV